MPFAAIAEHDRLDDRSPAQIVDVIERRLGRDQRAHDFIVAEMRGGDQRGAVIGACDVGGLAAAFERDLEHRHVVGDGGDRDDVVLLRFQRIGIGAEPHQCARRVGLVHEGGDMQRRAAVSIAGVDRRAGASPVFRFRQRRLSPRPHAGLDRPEARLRWARFVQWRELSNAKEMRIEQRYHVGDQCHHPCREYARSRSPAGQAVMPRGGGASSCNTAPDFLAYARQSTSPLER